MPTPVLVIFAGIVLWMLTRMLRFGGFKGALFGASILRTVGEAEGEHGSLVSRKVKVHVLSDPPEKAVGLEFIAKSFGSYQMTPVVLSSAEAQALIQLLQAATMTG